MIHFTPLTPGAHTLAAVRLLPKTLTHDARPALLLAAHTRHGLTLAHLPGDATWQLEHPDPLPTRKQERAGLTLDDMGGSLFTIESAGQHISLTVHSVRLLRELIRALDAFDQLPTRKTA